MLPSSVRLRSGSSFVAAAAWLVVLVLLAPPAHAQDLSEPSATPTSGVAIDHGGVVGDPTLPQPISTADANGGGANGQCPDGPYCSTRDGSASQNGDGVGAATGEPCAGCVGRADNKNPLGQMPGAPDGNAGYECDTNHGIARGNPAHTGCTSTDSPDCVSTEENPCVRGPVAVSPPGSASSVATSVAAAHRPRTLPNTGLPANLAGIALAGLGSVLAGVLLLRRRRLVRMH